MTESNPIEAARAHITGDAAPSQSTAATSDAATSATSDTPIKTTTNVYHNDLVANDKADSTNSTKQEARSSYRPGSKALDLPPPVTRSTISDSKTGPPLPVTTSASELPLPVCPDPAAHTHRDPRLQEQASNAALYVTKTGKSTKQKEDVLDANNKLSSRSRTLLFILRSSPILTTRRCRSVAQICQSSGSPQLPCCRH